MGPHQREPAGPVEVDLDDVADRRRVAVARLELVDDLAAGLAGGPDRPRSAVRCAQDEPAIRRLAAATRVEDRPIEDEQGRLAGLDRGDARLDRAQVGVRVAELLAGRRHRRDRRYCAVSVPVMFGWTVQTNA